MELSEDPSHSPPPRKYALVTGCTPGGIGHAFAQHLTRPPYNYHVFATVRDPSSPTYSALASNPHITLLQLDITSSPSLTSLITTLTTTTSTRLHLLINNAGRNYTVPFLESSMAEIRSVFETNVFGLMKLTHLLLPSLLAAARDNDPGPDDLGAGLGMDPSIAVPRVFRPVLAAMNLLVRTLSLGYLPRRAKAQRPLVINIGSLAGTIPYVFGSVYGASKAAVHAWGDTVRVELAPLGVDVVTVVTGGVKSNLGRVERRLKEGGEYSVLEEEYEARQKYAGVVGLRAEEYVDRVWRWVWVGGERGKVWEGGKIGMGRAAGWVPSWVVDWWMGNKFGLWKLGRGQGKKRV